MKWCLLLTAFAASIYMVSAAASTCVPSSYLVVGTRSCRFECGVDRPGGDYFKKGGLTLDECASMCNKDPECLTAQYHVANRFCYFKRKVNKAVKNAKVDGVVCDPPEPPRTTPSTTRTTTTTTTTTTSKTYTSIPTLDPRCHQGSVGCYFPGNVQCDGAEVYFNEFCICVDTPSKDLICATKPDNICDYGRSCTASSECDPDEVCALRVCNCNDDVNGVCFPAKDACTNPDNKGGHRLFERNPHSPVVQRR